MPQGLMIIYCGEKDEKPRERATYVSSWGTTIEGGKVACEMDQV